MPEYLAPGVYVEETSFRSKSIEGVGTSTTGFVGATRYGPVAGEPELMTSFSQFERIYGGLDPLDYGGTEIPNYLAHAVRNFFDNGGSRLYIARAYEPLPLPPGPPGETEVEEQARAALLGRGMAAVPAPAPLVDAVDGAAIAATSTVLGAVSTAVSDLQQARAAALTVLQYAVDQVLGVLTTTAPPSLNYDYGTGDNIETQLDDWITSPPAGLTPTESTDLTAAWTTWQPIVNGAETQWVAAAEGLEAGATAQTNVSAAYPAGVTAGDATDISSATPDLGALEADGNTATVAATAASTAAADLPAAATAVTVAMAAIANDSTASTANTAIGTLVTEANQVITAASGAVTPITTAATSATVERRLAIANADTDWIARFPGVAGNATVLVTGRLGANVLMAGASGPTVSQIRDGDLVVIQRGASAPIYSASRTSGTWSFAPASGSDLPLGGLDPNSDRVIPLTLTVEVIPPGRFAQPLLWDGLTVSDLPSRLRDSVTQVFAATIANRIQELETPVVLQARGTPIAAAQLAADLVDQADWAAAIASNTLTHTRAYTLSGGSDGGVPLPPRYEGMGDDSSPVKSGLKSFEDLEEIAIVAAPGYSYDWGTRRSQILTISQALINHCERMRYRVAVLDSPDDLALSGVREYRALLDTTRAALYYPWVLVNDPITNRDLSLPPSGFLAGIYARNDVEIGVHKAPANEVVRNAIGLEMLINKAQQDVLNPLGINCIRFFEGRGIRVWGARTVSSDPEWKYLNIRRYFAFLEASIDRSTQWAVFEPNGEQLWANIRRTVESFLENEWREGHLAGTKVEEAFFVRCDRSTMTQNDLDNGRLICLIGVAPLYPAEFVIFRIGQWTADRR